MNNRWFSKDSTPKKTTSEWRAGGRQEYADKHKDKFAAHRLQFFINDFKTMYPNANHEEILCRVVAFIGLYNNQVRCAPKIFNAARYQHGAMLTIGRNDLGEQFK